MCLFTQNLNVHLFKNFDWMKVFRTVIYQGTKIRSKNKLQNSRSTLELIK